MLPAFISFIFAFTFFVPGFFVLWVANTLRNWDSLRFYLPALHFGAIIDSFIDFVRTNSLFLLCVMLFLGSRQIVRLVQQKNPRYFIDVKSVKPADAQFLSIVFSFMPLAKHFVFTQVNDLIWMTVFIGISVIISWIFSHSMHFNLCMRLAGYRYYEIQSRKEFTYLLLSNRKIINPSQINNCAQLTDYMLVNASNNNH